MAKKIQLELNSIDNLELFLQEIADEAFRTYNQINDEISKIVNSTDLSSADMGEKASYGKIMHDYFTDKDRAHKARTDVAKIMTEVIKFKGNVKEATAEIDKQSRSGKIDLSDMRRLANEIIKEKDGEKKEYKIKTH